MTKTLKRIIFIIYDIFAVSVSTVFGLFLSSIKLIPMFSFVVHFILGMSVFVIILNFLFNLYDFSEKYASIYEMFAIALIGIIYGITSLVFAAITSSRYISISFAFISGMILVFMEAFSRFVFRLYKAVKSGTINIINKNDENNCLIVGAGEAGAMIIKDINNNPSYNLKPVGLIDDNKSKLNTHIYGVKVRGNRYDILKISKEFNVKTIIVALPSISKLELSKVLKICNETGAKVLTLPKLSDFISKPVNYNNLKDVSIEDLLGRDTIDVKDEDTSKYFKNKVVLVTGGGGSIGSELCRQIAEMDPRKIVIVDIYENCAYEIEQELKMKYHESLDLVVEIISITNKDALDRVFNKHKPNIVIMAAAHKHVPLMERNVIEAVENNIFGTLNTVELSIKYNVDRVHMVSTDKAVNPTSIMGATKRIDEMIVMSYSKENLHTTFSITRFGNVLGSAGSVIPLFKKQIQSGGPITLTDYRIIRYFMTIPEASSLVLKSLSLAKNGELFVLDMGEPVKIYDLARNMIRLSGLEPDVDIKIVETGLRPGEKLYEELLVNTEELDKTSNKLIFIERDKPLPLKDINNILSKLKDGIIKGDDNNMKNIIKEVVPTFKNQETINKDFTK